MNRILILLLSINLAVLSYAQGNSIPKTSKVKALEELPDILPDSIKYRFPLFGGLSVSVNIFDPVLELIKWKHANYEATLTADIHHRFFPQVSAGFGHSKESNDYDLRFVTKMAPFFKVGILYNFKYNDYRPDNFYYALIRYGMSKSTADIENLNYTDGYWDDYGPVTVTDQDFKCHWIEVGGGIKVRVMRHISLGWEATLRPLLSNGNNKHGKPHFVPGWGTSRFAFAFNLSYDIF